MPGHVSKDVRELVIFSAAGAVDGAGRHDTVNQEHDMMAC